ncbi:hypothetical protein H4219_004540 [Mycoemilia scoparia]|uniref:Uncharacterized protein n=1 Tax=Mycoemilia scoparia TaxID=417184 RepID=A0A9W8DQZ7_9FUNG|nr:hypothetical protein H4219_004540 [Mycoemilia scoparia]
MARFYSKSVVSLCVLLSMLLVAANGAPPTNNTTPEVKAIKNGDSPPEVVDPSVVVKNINPNVEDLDPLEVIDESDEKDVKGDNKGGKKDGDDTGDYSTEEKEDRKGRDKSREVGKIEPFFTPLEYLFLCECNKVRKEFAQKNNTKYVPLKVSNAIMYATHVHVRDMEVSNKYEVNLASDLRIGDKTPYGDLKAKFNIRVVAPMKQENKIYENFMAHSFPTDPGGLELIRKSHFISFAIYGGSLTIDYHYDDNYKNVKGFNIDPFCDNILKQVKRKEQ